MTRMLTRTFRPINTTFSRSLTTTQTRYFPADPKPSDPSTLSGGMGDSATLPRDKQAETPAQSQPGGAAGAPSSGNSSSGGPSEQAGVADPGIPKADAKNARSGMTKSDGEDSPARNS